MGKKISFSASFQSHVVKKDGALVITFLVPYTSLESVILVPFLISSYFVLDVSVNEEKFSIPRALFKNLRIDDIGESKLQIESSLQGLDETSFSFIILGRLIEVPLVVSIEASDD